MGGYLKCEKVNLKGQKKSKRFKIKAKMQRIFVHEIASATIQNVEPNGK